MLDMRLAGPKSYSGRNISPSIPAGGYGFGPQATAWKAFHVAMSPDVQRSSSRTASFTCKLPMCFREKMQIDPRLGEAAVFMGDLQLADSTGYWVLPI